MYQLRYIKIFPDIMANMYYLVIIIVILLGGWISSRWFPTDDVYKIYLQVLYVGNAFIKLLYKKNFFTILNMPNFTAQFIFKNMQLKHIEFLLKLMLIMRISETHCRDWFGCFKNNDFDVKDKKSTGTQAKIKMKNWRHYFMKINVTC